MSAAEAPASAERNAAMKARLVLLIFAAAISPASAGSAPYSYLAPGYVQQVYAVSPTAITSFAFAPNGDIWAVRQSPNALIRFDSHTTQVIHETELHPIIQTASVGPSVSPYSGVS